VLALTTGQPGPGQYAVVNLSGRLGVKVNPIHAGLGATLRLRWSEPATQPGDDVCIASSDYTAFARKRDVVTIWCQDDRLDNAIGLLPGKRLTFWWSRAVLRPGVVVHYSGYASNDKTLVPAGSLLVDAGAGIIYLRDTLVAALPERICFYLTEAGHGQD
jgi:hypothetical protein